MKTTPNPSGRDAWIDAARGLAAIAVVFFHFNCVIEHGGAASWRWFWAHGHWGVPVFFVLSGWCITASWERGDSPADFARRRLRRIFPPYLASWLLVVIVAVSAKCIRGVNDVTPLPRSAGALLANFSLVTVPVTATPPINWVYWSLSYELAFYGLLAALLFGRKNKVAALVSLHLGLCLWAALGSPLEPTPLFFVRHWPLFGLGSALYLIDRRPTAATVMLLGSATHAVVAGMRQLDFTYLVVAIAAGLALRVCEWITFPTVFNPLRRLGTISYSLYLIHVPVGVYVVLKILPPAGKGTASLIAEQLVAVAIVLGAAALFYRWFERPFLVPRAVSPREAIAPSRPLPLPHH